jgi:RNA polymerase sigma-70 factor, ECF subfamily
MVYSLARTLMWSLTESDPALSAAVPAVSERLFVPGAREDADRARAAAAADIEREVAELYAGRAPELLNYALLVARDEELARDALQEAFMRYFVARCGGATIASPRAWLYRVLHNYLLDRLRDSRTRCEQSLGHQSPFVDDRQDVEAGYLRAEVFAMARAVLTPREFDCFALRSQGMPYEEIASELQLRSGTVGALLSRAIRKVRKLVACAAGGAA